MGFLSSRRARLRAAFNAWQTKITNEKIAAEEKAARELQEAEDARIQALEDEAISTSTSYLSDINSAKSSIETSVLSITSKLASITGYSNALHSSSTSSEALTQYNHMVAATKDLSDLFTTLIQQKSLLDTAKDGLEKSKGSYDSTTTIYNNGITAYNSAVASFNSVKTSTADADEMIADGSAAMANMKADEAKTEALAAAEQNLADFVDSAPTTLDTLNELAAALGDDPNFSATISSQIGTKLNSSAYTASDVLTKIKTVDGSGSGLDADKLDGIQGSQFLRSDADDTMSGTLTMSGVNPTINFNGTSDAGIDMAIKATPEGLDFYEPEDTNKVHFQILDDAGVNAPYGYKVGSTQVIDSSGNVKKSPTLTLSGDLSGSAAFTDLGNATLNATVANDSHSHSNYVAKSGDTMTGQLELLGGSPQLKFSDNTSGADDFWIHVNSDSFYVLTDRDDNGSWDGAHPLRLDNSAASGTLYGSKFFTETYHPNADKWTTARTLSLTGDVTGSVSWDGSGNTSLSTTVGNDSHWHSQVYIPDTRGAVRAPSYYPDRYVSYDFQNQADTGAGDDSWHVLQTVAKWSSFHSTHSQQQIAYTGPNLKHREATSDTAWGPWKKVWDSGNDGSGSGLDADTVDGLHASSFLADSGKSLATSGYQKLSNGLIFQWRTFSVLSDRNNGPHYFPIAFPTACFNINVTHSGGLANTDSYLGVYSVDSTKFYAGNGLNQNRTCYMFAIGY